MSTADAFLDSLERDLVAGIRRRARRRRLRRNAAIGAVVLAAAGVLALAGTDPRPGSSPEPALAITGNPESVTVRVVEASAEPARMTAELRAAGIDGQVAAIPVSSEYVNRWVGVIGGRLPGSSSLDLNEQLSQHPGFLEIPRGVRDVVLIAGRPAEQGERTNVLPDGGTLPERPR